MDMVDYFRQFKESDYAKGVVDRVTHPGQTLVNALKEGYPTPENPLGNFGGVGSVGKMGKGMLSPTITRNVSHFANTGKSPEEAMQLMNKYINEGAAGKTPTITGYTQLPDGSTVFKHKDDYWLNDKGEVVFKNTDDLFNVLYGTPKKFERPTNPTTYQMWSDPSYKSPFPDTTR